VNIKDRKTKQKKINKRKISVMGFRLLTAVIVNILRCNTIQSGRNLPNLWLRVVSPISGHKIEVWTKKWRTVSPKYRQISHSHHITSRKTRNPKEKET
jgi:hypothetical protein